MNTEVQAKLLEAAKAMLETLEGEFCGGCPSSLLKPWEELENAVHDAEVSDETEQTS